ncbi:MULTISPECIES: hypothetical protein [Actinosynnema]|uniref:hypothetical protein n=1 Tax=Actinosynnema TaxID=40566 RepID=UPI0020A46BB7|nr:hypothetical protein [Actinosynnema pretiosum]MCP2098634.1 hypothetical protein [Actinosynnema pretiosum]
MSEERLTLHERAVLLVLMAEARELTNPQLREVAGFTLDGAARRRLNDLGLVTSTKVGRGFAHELTDRGAVRCAEELGAPRHPRSGYAGGALASVLAGLGRHLDATGGTVAEVFRPDPVALVLAAHGAAGGGKGGPVRLADLRERLLGVPRADVDRALGELALREGVHLWGEDDQKALTDRDREAALVLGGTARHLLVVAP